MAILTMTKSSSGLLAVDIGNTNIHLGLWQENMWRLSWRARTVTDKMPDEYAVLVRNFLSSANVKHQAVTGVIISSVVPPLTMAWAELVRRYMNTEPLIVNHKTKTGVAIAVDQPEQVGADRIVNSAAVVALYGGGPSISIDFGTATTFDIVNERNEYAGGAISPGIGVAHDALVNRAARLHKVDLVPPPNPIGKNTIHAMQSGIFWGYVGLVEGMVQRLKHAMGHPHIPVLATGGLAPLFKEHTSVIDQTISELTLDGLRVIYELNQ
jgi:type III pantothenate kinase